MGALTEFEYRVEDFSISDDAFDLYASRTTQLNRWASLGWVLVSVSDNMAYLRRTVPDTAIRKDG